MNYSEISSIYPHFTHFYEVLNLTLPAAMDRCARMTGDQGHVAQLNGKIYFIVKHSLGYDNDWLKEVDGTPIDVEVHEI